MRVLTLLSIAWLAAACSALQDRAYVELGAGVKLPSSSPTFIGRDPTARIAAGLELEHTLRCEWEHTSHYFDGPPFNRRPESRLDTLGCVKRWGARPRP